MSRTVLAVDDERNMLTVIRMTLEQAGYRVLTAERAEDAIGLLRDPDLDVVLTDLKMPGMSGEEFVARARQERPDVPVIVVTAYGSIRSAIECIQAGATDYLCKPFEPEDLEFTVQTALRLHDLLEENRRLHAVVSTAQSGRRLIGQSPAMHDLLEEIRRVSPYKTNVLITGESGTGKEAVARTIHEWGPRSEQPWVAINCSAIPRELMESELFGYVKGAFTGAIQSRMGRLEQAHGGTLFLDEIGDLDPELQAKLLRVLQEREFSPLGSESIRRIDVRVIAATNRDLRQLVREGRFRRGPALSPRCLQHSHPAVARTPGGHPVAGAVLPRRPARGDGQTGHAILRCRPGGAVALRLAGQCARTAQRRGTLVAELPGRHHRRR